MVQLVCNYRSHPNILALPSRLFYGDSLRAHAAPELTALPDEWSHITADELALLQSPDANPSKELS